MTAKKQVAKKKTTKKKVVKRPPRKTSFQPGNQMWRLRKKTGANLRYKTPKDLWGACEGYFKWVDENPILESKMFMYQGETVKDVIPRMRAMTVVGLCLYLGINRDTWYEYKKRQEYADVCEHVEDIIYEQKFSGAAADQLNQVIIARDLGLREQTDMQLTGRNGGPIETLSADMDPIEAARLYKEMLAGGK